MFKESILSELDDFCQDLSNRDKLELLKSLRSELDVRITSLTSSEDGHLYNNSFRAVLMDVISKKFPNLDSYTSYNKYQALRKSIVDRLNLSTNTKMLTKDEYEKCLQYLKDEGYDIDKED